MRKTRAFFASLLADRFGAVLTALVLSALSCQTVFAVTYLKADAPAGGDGASWETACVDFDDALAKAGSGDKTIYAADGVYFVTNLTGVTDGFEIYGGFPGLSAEETLADRDTEKYQTVFTGDIELDDHWVHVEPVPGEYRFSYTDLADAPVFVDGRFSPPPAYTGDYDAYLTKAKGASRMIYGAEIGSGVVFDGLWFVSCLASLDIPKGAVGNRINDCRFIGGWVSATISDRSGKLQLTRCVFRNLTGTYLGVRTRGATLIEDCRFESLVRENSWAGGILFFWSAQEGGNARVRGCVFTRSLNRSTNEEKEGHSYNAPANIATGDAGSGTFDGCVISNCLSTSAFRYGLPIFGLRRSSVSRCSFLNNRYEVKPVEGRAYSLFGISGQAGGFHQNVEGCTFRGNVVAAPRVAATAGSYALAIAGNGCDGCFYSFVNCTFDANSVEHAEVEGVRPILSRGIVGAAFDASVEMEVGVANCTFSGPSVPGVHDIIQVGPYHDMPFIVVNSLFMADGEADPFYLAAPQHVVLQDCTVKDWVASDPAIKTAGLRHDAVPLERLAPAAPRQVPVLLPAVRVPGLRESSDVATNEMSALDSSYRYRPAGETTWQALLPNLNRNALQWQSPAIGDANGHPRPYGAFTRGAAQPLAENAENGVSLTLRREPLDGGTLSSPFSQAVPAGTAIRAVTATPAKGNTFVGWFETDGTLYSADPVLAIPSLEADQVLVARFGTPERNITFDLGKAGLFKENGKSTITIAVGSGLLFPETPAFEPADGWLVDGWDPAFPSVVPDRDQAYKARYVTTGVNIVHVVPADEVLPGSDGSGSSWANATSDLSAAIAEASRYRGEVWIKEGRYPLRGGFPGHSNLAIIGGFAGDETSAAAADPVAHPVVITGDISGDDVWMADGKATGTDPAIWTPSGFVEPNPDGKDLYWAIGDPSGDDEPFFLNDANGAFTNLVLSGVTLTGFSVSIASVVSLSELILRDCAFIANGAAQRDVVSGLIDITDGSLVAEKCDFVGNFHLIKIKTERKDRPGNIIRDCSFRGNYSIYRDAPCIRLDRFPRILIEGSSFERNCSISGNASVIDSNLRERSWTIENCLFRGNRGVQGCRSMIMQQNFYGGLIIRSSRFIGNSVSAPNTHPNYVESSACIVRSRDGEVIITDSYFEGNSLDSAVPSDGKRWSSVLSVNSGHTALLVNNTFTGNRVDCPDGSDCLGTIVAHSPLVLLHDLIDGSVFTGNGAEIVLDGGNEGTTYALVNTVIRNDAENYRPFSLRVPTVGVSLAHVAISGLDASTLPTTPDDYRLGVISSVPGSLTPPREGPNGVFARGISGASPYGRAGMSVWHKANCGYVFWDDVSNPSRPWRVLASKTYRLGPTAYDLSREDPPFPDAFGAPRVHGKIAYGPLNAPMGGTILFLR